jgi:hypothetical protein
MEFPRMFSFRARGMVSVDLQAVSHLGLDSPSVAKSQIGYFFALVMKDKSPSRH